jgi:hypothetical protein
MLGGGYLLALALLPVPGQQVVDAPGWVILQCREDLGYPSLRIDVIELCWVDECEHNRCPPPPRSDPVKSHERRPSASPRSGRSAALSVRQMRPSSRKRMNASARLSIVHRLGDVIVPRERAALAPHPIEELVDQRCDVFLTYDKPLLRQQTIDRSLGHEDSVGRQARPGKDLVEVLFRVAKSQGPTARSTTS